MTEPINEQAEQYRDDEHKANHKKRLQWVIIALVVVILGCGLATAATVGIGGMLYSKRSDMGDIGNWRQSQGEVIERSFEVNDDAELIVDSFAGPISVVSADIDEIRVTATKRARVLGNLDKVTVEMGQSGDTVRVDVKKRGVVNNVSVEIVVQVPERTSVDLHSSAGSIRVEGLEGDVEAQTSAGDVRVAHIEGDVRAESNAGKVTLDDVEGDVRAHSSAGSVRATNMRGPVRLNSNAGAVEYEGEPWDRCEFESSAGSVTLRLPADLDADIDASASAGSVKVDFDVDGKVEKNRVKGEIGRGGQADITAHSSAGSVNVYKR